MAFDRNHCSNNLEIVLPSLCKPSQLALVFKRSENKIFRRYEHEPFILIHKIWRFRILCRSLPSLKYLSWRYAEKRRRNHIGPSVRVCHSLSSSRGEGVEEGVKEGVEDRSLGNHVWKYAERAHTGEHSECIPNETNGFMDAYVENINTSEWSKFEETLYLTKEGALWPLFTEDNGRVSWRKRAQGCEFVASFIAIVLRIA